MEWLARLQRLADIRICKEMIEEVLMAGMWTEIHYRNIITNLNIEGWREEFKTKS